MAMIYLGCPYTHQDPIIRNDRAELASMYAAQLMLEGHTVYSPITHGHAVASHLTPAVSSDHEFWMKQCLPILALADSLVILPLPGWRESRGLTAEIASARTFLIPVYFLQDTLSYLPKDRLEKFSKQELWVHRWQVYGD